MVQYNPLQILPSDVDLPETDNQPVDNELQLLIPTLLRAILTLHWAARMDWFMGVNLGVYYDPIKPAICPDGFLSVGVPRFRPDGRLRLSYPLWQEHDVVPQWVLELVSKTSGHEYTDKMVTYAAMGVLYYTVYNPDYWRRDRHDPFETYRLTNGNYVRIDADPVWMPEVGLGIGCASGTHDQLTRDWLYWYTEEGERLPAPDNVIARERQRAEQSEQRFRLEQQRADRAEQELAQERRLREQERSQREALLEKLRQRGINPDEL
jgi:Uma2 family endonuclease